MPVTYRQLDASGVEIVEAGTGPTTIVFAPGFGAGAGQYEPFLSALGEHVRVIGLSPRGFGRSRWSPPYTPTGWVDDVEAAAEFAATPVIGVGHSFGAYLTLGAAAQRPELFSTVVSLDQLVDLARFAPLAAMLNDYWQQIRRAVHQAEGDVDELVERLGQVVDSGGRLDDQVSTDDLRRMAIKWSTQDPLVLASLNDDDYGEWIADPALRNLSDRVRCPVVSILGDPAAGSIVSHELAPANAAAFRDVRQVRIDGVGHGLGLDEDPRPVVDLILEAINDGS